MQHDSPILLRCNAMLVLVALLVWRDGQTIESMVCMTVKVGPTHSCVSALPYCPYLLRNELCRYDKGGVIKLKILDRFLKDLKSIHISTLPRSNHGRGITELTRPQV